MRLPSFSVRVLSFALGLFTAAALPAAPAPRDLHEFHQPNGLTFSARIGGDEFFGYYRTADGHPIVRDAATGWWHYAAPAAEGVGPATPQRVGVDAPPSAAQQPVEPTAAKRARADREYTATVPPVRRSPARGGAPSPTEARIAMFCTTFADTATQYYYRPSDIEAKLFSTDPAEYSARRLYQEMSYGLHTISSGPAGIQPWAVAPQDMDHYGRPPLFRSSGDDGNKLRELARWRVQHADATFNFGPYDTDLDGYVDIACLVVQGLAETDGGGPDAIWPAKFHLEEEVWPWNESIRVYQTGDLNALGLPVKVKDFMLVPERGPNGSIPGTPAVPVITTYQIAPVGVFCHEYGHALGLPDLYDSDGSSEGVGDWCLMGTGCLLSPPVPAGSAPTPGARPAWASAWCRAHCGWVTPQNLTTNRLNFWLKDAKSENKVLRMWTLGATEPEYFLVEHRAKIGFDEFLPGSGLQVWHIDGTRAGNTQEFWRGVFGVPDRTTSGNYQVALVQADGLFELERKRGRGNAEDVFTPARWLAPSMTQTYAGVDTHVAIQDLADPPGAVLGATPGLLGTVANFYVSSDTVVPQITESLPYQTTETVVNQLHGTAWDNVAVTNVYLTIERLNPTNFEFTYYNSTLGWLSVNPEILGGIASANQATLTGPANNPQWSFSLPAVPPGVYLIKARARDSSGSIGPDWRTTFRVVDDPNGPDATFTEPSPQENYATNPVPNFTGTAINTTAPFTVETALQQESGDFAGRFFNWSGNSFSAAGAFTSANVLSHAASPWSVNMAARTLPDGRYYFFARVLNGDTRISGWRSVAFRVGQPVRVQVSRPVHGSYARDIPAISGTFNDPTGTGIQGNVVSFTLTDPQGRFWNGSAWTNSAVTLSAPLSAGGWSYSQLPPPASLLSGTYHLNASITANNGETSAALAGVNQTTFVVDLVPPEAAVVSPLQNAVITTSPLPLFNGTLSDPGGIGYVNCYIRRNRDLAYWTGAVWTEDSAHLPHGDEEDLAHAPPIAILNSSYNAAAGTWTCTSPLPAPRVSMENGGYTFIVIVADLAGNYTQAEAAMTLDYHQVFVWTGATLRDGIAWNDSTDWNVPANWQPWGIPGAEDYVLLANGDTINNYATRTVRGFRLSNGTIQSSAGVSLTTTHDSTWTGGNLGGEWNNAAGATTVLSGTAGKYFNSSTTINNHGLVDWQGGERMIANSNTGTPVTWNNHAGGILRISADDTIFSQSSTNVTAVFNNLTGGRIEKTAGSGTIYWYYWTLHNHSDIFLNSGGLYLNLNTTNLHPGSALMGGGTLWLNTSVYLRTDIFATAAVNFLGGFISATDTMRTWSGPGVLNWTDGTFYGRLTRAPGTYTSIEGTEHKLFADGAEFINEGTVIWSGTGNLQAQGTNSPAAIVRNRGQWSANGGADLVPLSANYEANFYNESGATFTKTHAQTTHSTWRWHNAGTVNVLQGWLEWHRNGTHTGEFNIASGCTLYVLAGTHSMADGTPFAGAGNVLINGATVNAAGVLNNNLGGGVEHRAGWISVNPQFRGSGLWKWTGGGISGTASLGAGCTMEVSGTANNKDFWDDTTFDNYGTFVWQGGTPIFARNTSGTPLVFNNHSVLRLAADGDMWSRRSANLTSVFNNLPGARIEKTGGTGTNYWYYWTLNNESEIALPTGGLYFNANRVNFRDGTAFAGTGTLYLDTNVYLYASDIHSTVTTDWRGGSFTSVSGATRAWAGPGPFSWTGGTLYGSLKLAAGTTFLISGDSNHKTMADGSEIINEGTLTWTGAGNIVGTSSVAPGAVIRNRGVFIADTGSDFVPSSANVFSNFYNEAGATFSKTNPGTTYSTWQFHNAGTVNINEGWLEWHRNGTHTGTFNIAANSWLHVYAGTHSMADGMTFTGAGNLLINGASVNAAGVLNNNLGGGVEHRAGWISVNPQLRGSGLWKWTGGGISGTASLGAGCTLEVSGEASHKEFYDDTTFDNYGTFIWQGGGQIRSRNTSGAPLVFNNHSEFRLTADGAPLSVLSTTTTTVFNNLPGARIENTGPGTVYWYYWTLNNESEIAIPQGGLYFYVNRVNFHEGSGITGAGIMYLNTNAYLYCTRLHSTVTTNWIGVFLSAVGGTRTWAGPGPLNWTSGTLYGSIKLEAGVNVAISGDSNHKTMADGSEIINEGTLTWTGAGNIVGTSSVAPGAVIRNRSVFIADTGSDFVPSSANVFSNFYNEAGATFTKTNPGTTYSTWQFHNAGTVNINEGWLEWHRNGTHTGTFNIAANCWLHVFAGTHSMADGMTFSGAGNVLVQGATVNAAGVLMNNLGGGFEHRAGWISVNPQLRGPGPWKWTGGGISGTASLGAGCTMEVSGAANHKDFWDNTTFDNYGTFTWQGGGTIFARNTSGTPFTFNNHSTVRIAADGDPWGVRSANLTSVFNNKPGARIEKTGGTGTNYWYYWTLNNESEISVPTGGLYFYVSRTNLHEGSAFTGTGIVYLRSDAYLYASRIAASTDTRFIGVFLSAVGGTRTWAGPFTWTEGTLWGSMKFEAGSNVTLSGTGVKEFAPAAELINEGTVTVTGTGVISGRTQTASVTIRNRPGALWRQDTTAYIQWQSANNAGLFENAGNVEIGPGVFYLNGWRFTQTATGAIHSDVTATGHDQIYVYNVPVTAAGTLHLRRAPGFTPPQGTYYNVLTGTSRSGTFANVTGGFDASYQPTLARVTVQPPAETYDQWIAAAGFTGLDALRIADPDNDGADNLTEFAFKGNPALSGDLTWERSLQDINGEQWITLHYRRWQDREQAGIVYEPGASPALSTWDLAGLIDEPDPAAPAIPNSTAWRARIRLGGQPHFLRVSVRDATP